MTSDIFLIAGLVAFVLAIPAAFSAYSESVPPRGAIFLVAVGLGFVAGAWFLKPEGYAIGDIPDAFMRVLGSIFN